ncbi:hypothetical protein [Holospora undulata]|nr:hypothetical protein [Holospora undulata]
MTSVFGNFFIQGIAQNVYAVPSLNGELNRFYASLTGALTSGSSRVSISDDLKNYFNNPEILADYTSQALALKQTLETVSSEKLLETLFCLDEGTLACTLKVLDHAKAEILNDSLKAISPEKLLKILFDLEDNNALGRALKILNQAKPGALNKLFSDVSKNFHFGGKKDFSDQDITCLSKALVVMNRASNLNFDIDANKVREVLNDFGKNEDSLETLFFKIFRNLTWNKEASYCFHVVSVVERITSFEDQLGSKNRNELSKACVATLKDKFLFSFSESFRKFLISNQESLVWIFNNSILNSFLDNAFIVRIVKQLSPSSLARILDFSLKDDQESFAHPEIFTHSFDRLISIRERRRSLNDFLDKFLSKINEELDQSLQGVQKKFIHPEFFAHIFDYLTKNEQNRENLNNFLDKFLSKINEELDHPLQGVQKNFVHPEIFYHIFDSFKNIEGRRESLNDFLDKFLSKIDDELHHPLQDVQKNFIHPEIFAHIFDSFKNIEGRRESLNDFLDKFLSKIDDELHHPLQDVQKNFIHPEIFAHIFDSLIELQDSKREERACKLLDKLFSRKDCCDILKAFLYKKGVFAKILMCSSELSDAQRFFDHALMILTKNPENLFKELDYILQRLDFGLPIGRFHSFFDALITSDLEVFSHVFSILEKNIDWNNQDKFLSKLISMKSDRFINYLLTSLSKKYENEYDFILAILTEDTQKISENLLIQKILNNYPKTIDEILSKVLKNLEKDQYKALQNFVACRVQGADLFCEKNKINIKLSNDKIIVLDFDVDMDNLFRNTNFPENIRFSAFCNFIKDTIKGLSQHAKIEIVQQALRKDLSNQAEIESNYIDIAAFYLNLTNTSFKDLDEVSKHIINLNFQKTRPEKKILLLNAKEYDKDLYDSYKEIIQEMYPFEDLKRDKNSKEKKDALVFFDENFQEEDKVECFARYLDIFFPEDKSQYLEDLIDFKLGNFKKAIHRVGKRRLRALEKEKEKLNELFTSQKINAQKIDFAETVKNFIDEKFSSDYSASSISLSIDEIISESLRKNYGINKKNSAIDYQKLKQAVLAFSLFYNSFRDPSSRKEEIQGFSQKFGSILFFIGKAKKFENTTNNEFLKYLDQHNHIKKSEYSASPCSQGEKFFIDGLGRTNYEALLGEFNEAVKKQKIEKLLITQENKKFIYTEIAEFFMHYSSREDKKSIKNTNKKFFGNSSFEVVEYFMGNFTQKCHDAGLEEREVYFKEFTTSCLNALDGKEVEVKYVSKEKFPYFLKFLRNASKGHIDLYKETEQYKNEVYSRHPYFLLKYLFEGFVVDGANGKERCRLGMLADTAHFFLAISDHSIDGSLDDIQKSVMNLRDCTELKNDKNYMFQKKNKNQDD